MKSLLFFCLLVIAGVVMGQSYPLIIPDTLSGSDINLTMHRDSVQFFPGSITYTYAFNANKYLGPTIILNNGDDINISVSNQIGDTTTVHWHGLHVPSKWDGGPHTVILPGASWNPQIKVMDYAATYWYHPHLHMKTAEQAIKGAAGLIIVRDSVEAALVLPRKYGTDDFPVIIQVQQYDSLNQAMPTGMQDSIILVNGARANYGYTVFADMPSQVVRMRLLNASGERVINLGFTDNKQFYQIGSDGGLLNTPFFTSRVRLAPGERAEILLDLTGMIGQTIFLKSYSSELPMGVQGGATMPMPGGPPMDSPLNGVDYTIMQINVVSQTADPVTAVPTTLTVNTPYPSSEASNIRTIRFTADNQMVMDGPFYFNDSTFNITRIDYHIPLNSIEIWKLVNETMVAHPFHIHDVQFYIIDRNGNPPGPEESGRKDVVLVPPGDSVLFITKFDDFSDTLIPFMYHCHILMHEDDGMMGQFLVVPNSTGVGESGNDTSTMAFPNPFFSYVTIQYELEKQTEVRVNLTDISGRLVYDRDRNLQTEGKHSLTIDLSQLSSGIYFANITLGDTTIYKMLMKASEEK